MKYLEEMSFHQIIWLVPILFSIHNLEELPSMEKWIKQTRLPIHKNITTFQYGVAVTFLSLLAFFTTWLANNGLKFDVGVYLVLEVQAIILINSIIPHIGMTIRDRKYNPGVATAILINLPFSIYLLSRAIKENYIDIRELIIMISLAPTLMVLLIIFSLKLGQIVDRYWHKTYP